MKYLITENKLRSLLKKWFDFDLDERIKHIEKYDDLPREYKFIMEPIFDTYINEFGQVYSISSENGDFLVQYRGKFRGWEITNKMEGKLSEKDLMEYLGIGSLGLGIDELMELYLKGDE